ncbi:MAG: response regulator, partial [Chloroflexi bacterium]|nr:response regulator [Chloroflexota bacterium]
MSGELILLVDDEANIIELAKMYLERENFRILSVGDGAKAVEMIRDEKPALVVLDVMLPSMDGYEVCRKVRAESDVPIIMLTARDEDID